MGLEDELNALLAGAAVTQEGAKDATKEAKKIRRRSAKARLLRHTQEAISLVEFVSRPEGMFSTSFAGPRILKNSSIAWGLPRRSAISSINSAAPRLRMT